MPFRVDGLTLRYLGPFALVEDRLVQVGAGFHGRAYLGGVEVGRFELQRP